MKRQIESRVLERLYKTRFGPKGEAERMKKNTIWRVLCKYFFQKYIEPDSIVVDVAAGYCEFINNIKAKKKIAVDMNPDIRTAASSKVRVIVDSVFSLEQYIEKESVDVFFVSNFLEHLDSKEDVIQLIQMMLRLLKKGVRILILQPNIRLVKGAYWDFIDHKIELTEKSIIELAEMTGLQVEKCITRFLPYTTKSALPQSAFFIRMYLYLMPISGILAGKQSFLVLRK